MRGVVTLGSVHAIESHGSRGIYSKDQQRARLRKQEEEEEEEEEEETNNK